MVAVKAHEADAFLRNLPSKFTALVFFGSDDGLIAERAQTVVAAEEYERGELGWEGPHKCVGLVCFDRDHGGTGVA